MKLLIADDDKISGILLVKHASARGFDPIYVQNGRDALEELSKEKGPKIALLDWMMPGLTGLEIIEKLRCRSAKNGGRHYLIILTAKSEKEDVVTALKAGADDYIVKPFDSKELKARLEVGRRIINLTDNLSKALAEAKRLSNFIAHFDQTTGLPNYLSLLEEIDRIRSSSDPHSLFLINLDNFKIINQVYGISNGDIVLNFAGAKIKQALGMDVFVARVAADEFAAIVPLKGRSFGEFERQILDTGERLRDVFSHPFPIEGDMVTITMSIGVSTIVNEIEGAGDEFIRRADFALKRAKRAGGNRTFIHDPLSEKELRERYRLERELESAMEQDQLRMFLQPQFTKDGLPVAAEALVRWEHPEKGLIPPGLFIPIAEQSELVIKMGEVMIQKACRLIAETAENRFTISVNVSPRQFQHHGFVDFVKETLEKTGADPSRLILEVTEGLLINDIDWVIKRMKELTSEGVNFSVDDFGTGYSSLIYLKRLPIKELKIDRAFVKDLPNDKNDVAIVETIISIARHLGFKLVAEGVETGEQVAFLAARGEMLFQGYHFAKPEAAERVIDKYFSAS